MNSFQLIQGIIWFEQKIGTKIKPKKKTKEFKSNETEDRKKKKIRKITNIQYLQKITSSRLLKVHFQNLAIDWICL